MERIEKTEEKIEKETNEEEKVEEEKVEEENVKEEKEPDRFSMRIEKGFLEHFLKPVSTITDEGGLTVDENGITMRVVDPANVCMVSVSLKNEGIEEYSYGKGKIGLPVERMLKLLGSAKKDDEILVEYLPERNRIRMAFGNLRYDVALLDLDGIKKEPKMPKIEVPVKTMMEGKEFRRVVMSANKISDCITFKANADGIIIESEGETSDMLFEMEKEDMIDFSISSDAREVKSSFSLDYMEDLSKIMAESDEITMRFGADYPCMLVGTFADGHGTVEYLLAPRIED